LLRTLLLLLLWWRLPRSAKADLKRRRQLRVVMGRHEQAMYDEKMSGNCVVENQSGV